jgi:hypothetical protein
LQNSDFKKDELSQNDDVISKFLDIAVNRGCTEEVTVLIKIIHRRANVANKAGRAPLVLQLIMVISQ